MKWLLAVVAIASLDARLALAENISAAREHYQRGTTLYDLQRYADAAKEYEAAYEAKPDPALLFNIGQAYRFAGDYSRAIGAFRSYLRRLPRSGNREEVDARIVEMQKLLDDQKANQQKPPGGTISPVEMRPREPEAPAEPVVPAPAPRVVDAPSTVGVDHGTAKSARTKKIAGLAVAGFGVAAIAVGAAFAVLAKSAFDEINTPAPGYVFRPETRDALKTDQVLEAVFFAVGGAAVVAGVTVAVLGWREARAGAHRARLNVGGSLAGAALQLGF